MSRYRNRREVTTIYIHCADTPNGREHTAADIDQWHGPGKISQGLRPYRRSDDARFGTGPWQGENQHAIDLKHIGYHYVIRINGAVEVGRRETETGAHVRGHNHDSLGIVMFGRDKYTQAQWDSLKALVNGLLHRWQTGFNRTLKVRGHYQEDPGKTCPGFDVPAWLRNDKVALPGHVLELPQ